MVKFRIFVGALDLSELTCLIVWPLACCCPLQTIYTRMQITWPWRPVDRLCHGLKTKGNVNIKLRDLCETLIVYILLCTFQLVHIVLTVNKPDAGRFITWIVSWLKPLYRWFKMACSEQPDTCHRPSEGNKYTQLTQWLQHRPSQWDNFNSLDYECYYFISERKLDRLGASPVLGILIVIWLRIGCNITILSWPKQFLVNQKECCLINPGFVIFI